MKISEVLMTPADAARLLQVNTHNRNLRQNHVAAIAAIITNDEWRFDGNPIKISRSGWILDGQHRLAAIVRAGKAVPTLLAEDVEDDAQLIVDTGKPRRFADHLSIQGYVNGEQLASVTSLWWRYRHGVLAWEGDIMKRPVANIIDLWELFQAEEDAILAAVPVGVKVSRQIHASRSVVACGWIACRDLDEDDAEDFYAQLANERARGNPATQFARYMDSRDGGYASIIRKGNADQRYQMALLFKCWNAYREGREITSLRWRRGGSSPEGFPEPH